MYVMEGTVLTVGERAGSPTLTAWWIHSGAIGGVDVSDQVVVVLTAGPRREGGGPAARFVLVDEPARPEQVLAVLDAFGGRLGGRLAEPAEPLAEPLGFAQVPIDHHCSPGRSTLVVPDRLRVVARFDPPPPPGAAPPVQEGLAEVWADLPEYDLAWETQTAAATCRMFHHRSGSDDVGAEHQPRNDKEADMANMTPDEMNRVIDAHFAAEGVHDIEGLLATLTDDAEHDVVGLHTEPRQGRERIRDYYEQHVFKLLRSDEVRPLRRYHGDNFMVDEVLYTGHADGAVFGADGHEGQVSFRLLHVVEFRDGRISRENVWLDSDTARRQLLSAGETL